MLTCSLDKSRWLFVFMVLLDGLIVCINCTRLRESSLVVSALCLQLSFHIWAKVVLPVHTLKVDLKLFYSIMLQLFMLCVFPSWAVGSTNHKSFAVNVLKSLDNVSDDRWEQVVPKVDVLESRCTVTGAPWTWLQGPPLSPLLFVCVH